ncbi:hypothetical protein HTV45_26515 [Streptomyces sp. CHD11]|uniref:hypothetical protein n=1 Tax=Streptomyces sp. CHD11 TaxID=2741325 RepID=UPI001BFC984C|nr:hypothetical protein [Streptomyces sp. CHD11]MBT3154382.1 hypothetical protein [Streptomyces sp. CHD11]
MPALRARSRRRGARPGRAGPGLLSVHGRRRVGPTGAIRPARCPARHAPRGFTGDSRVLRVPRSTIAVDLAVAAAVAVAVAVAEQ